MRFIISPFKLRKDYDMKRIIALILALFLLFCLCACNQEAESRSEMMKELKTGSWTTSLAIPGYYGTTTIVDTYTFKNEGVVIILDSVDYKTPKSYTGTYEVTDTTINIFVDTEGMNDHVINYTYEDGFLELTSKAPAGDFPFIHNK